MRRAWAALVVAVCLLPVLLALEFPMAGAPPASDESVPYQAQDKVNLNTAVPAQLCLLPDIGEKRAQAIVDYRAEHGNFKTLDQLDGVEGISSATIQKLEPYVTLG